MTVEDLDAAQTKLVTDYEALRRREYELISDMLDVLPKVDNLPEAQLVQMRDALFHADHPYMVAFVGPFSGGKSSIINALMGKPDLMPVGVTPTTDHISLLRWGEEPDRIVSGAEVESVFYPSPLLKKVAFVDTPGLESIFKQHEDATRNFLHRSDVVFLVMLATQAMTARNLEYLQQLRDYGTKVIILINQADLLSDEEAQTVLDYVRSEAKSRLTTEPDVWLISAKKAMKAQQDGTLDEALWHESGLDKIVHYVDSQLSDVDRLRQKLRTPLQIAQNVSQSALKALRVNAAAMDAYQNIAENLDQQLAAQRRDQEKSIRETTTEVSSIFGEATMQGSEAIHDVFAFQRALGSLWRGLGELVGLSGLRRGQDGGFAQRSFEEHGAARTLDELSTVTDRLAPRMEGRDVQDIDDLVKFARREIKALPETIQDKVIGEVKAPVQYDRRALQSLWDDLDPIEGEARQIEVGKLDQTLRNASLSLVVYEILLLLLAFFVSQVAIDSTQGLLTLFVVAFGMALLGLAYIPLRGRMLETAYTRRMLDLQRRYVDTITEAARKQLDYGMQLRREAVGPLTRLVEAQTEIQKGHLEKLETAQRELASIESSLTSLGKRRILGR